MLEEGDMPRDVNTAGDKIQASITFVFIRVAEKHTGNRARREFVGGGGRGVGKTETTENTEFRIVRMTKKEGVEGCRVGVGFGGSNV
jgi:hypothetical protein